MTDDPEVWPPYEVGQPKHIHALGVIAAKYNGLEFSLFCLMMDYTGLSSETAQWLFANLSNNLRLDLLKRCVREKETEPVMKEYVLHFADCFDVCAENRNILMHSMVGKTNDAALLNFAKSSKNDPRKVNTLDLRLGDIRRVADAITIVDGMGLQLHSRFLARRSPKPPDLPDDLWAFVTSLPKKPPIPSKLLKQNPPARKA